MATQPPEKKQFCRPLVVNLDGTLLRGNSFFALFLCLFLRNDLLLLKLSGQRLICSSGERQDMFQASISGLGLARLVPASLLLTPQINYGSADKADSFTEHSGFGVT